MTEKTPPSLALSSADVARPAVAVGEGSGGDTGAAAAPKVVRASASDVAAAALLLGALVSCGSVYGCSDGSGH